MIVIEVSLQVKDGILDAIGTSFAEVDVPALISNRQEATLSQAVLIA